MPQKGLFVFRRDLRVHDNTGLLEACKLCREVIPIFIFDSRQITPHPYYSAPGLSFMTQALNELKKEIETLGGSLHIFEGKASEKIEQILEATNCDAVFVNRDYTPFSLNRDIEIKDVCTRRRVTFLSFDDSLLHSPEKIKKGDRDPYTVFTPFYKAAQKFTVNKPRAFISRNLSKAIVPGENTELLNKITIKNSFSSNAKGSRDQALSILNAISNFSDYNTTRDFPAIIGTTRLSAHNKFGTVSIREVYHSIFDKLGTENKLISELFWRDFFTHIAFHFPHVFKGSFHKKYDAIEWDEPNEKFIRWKEGVTGFPIVDAGMRELVSTGWMHNRVRMIVASFLTKDLHISWREGERFFANHLVDYDPSVNNGSWQWAASTGCDAQPYFRIFNPWLQQKKFDPECEYIKKWVPELEELSPAAIHSLEDSCKRPNSYPEPIVDHSEASVGAKALFTNIS